VAVLVDFAVLKRAGFAACPTVGSRSGGTHLPLFEVGLAGDEVAKSLTGQFHKRFSERFDLMIKGKGLNDLKKYRSVCEKSPICASRRSDSGIVPWPDSAN
jgi:hypothetical protein